MSHAMPYLKWLAQLQVGDKVVPVIHGQRKEPQEITSAPRTSVQIGKYAKAMRFSRKDGVVCGKRPLKHLFRIEQP